MESRVVMATATIMLKDAFLGISDLEDNSIDALITDPPYFLDGMDDTWQKDMITRKNTKNQVVKSLRTNMRFNKQQGIDFQIFMEKVASTALPKIKPGGWLISFSAPRLYHRMTVGIEDAGYEIRDMWQWLYTQNQMKAMSIARTMKKDDSLTFEELQKLSAELEIWKTPQVRSNFEPIVLAQKPREGTFYENWRKYNVGLINVKSNAGSNNSATSNVMTTDSISEIIDKTFLVAKPNKKEKGSITHLSVKPLELMKHLIKVTVPENGLVLDPFNGSGTTGIAALFMERNFMGFENNENYFNESKMRNEQHFRVIANENSFTVDSVVNSEFNLFLL